MASQDTFGPEGDLRIKCNAYRYAWRKRAHLDLQRCGKQDVWDNGWSWYGSIKNQEKRAEPRGNDE